VGWGEAGARWARDRRAPASHPRRPRADRPAIRGHRRRRAWGLSGARGSKKKPTIPAPPHPRPPQVSRHDTLAGVAVRYGVSPADVRRANGLVSDTCIFARPTLLVPTGPLEPVR